MTFRSLVILGPTASGKSSLAMALATSDAGRDVGIELLSIDAMQVYRGMDIGTAKPTVSEQALVRHHLIDLVDATQAFTVAQFQIAYQHAVDDITSRGGRALLVGGTGLYVRAVVDGLTLPGQWPEVRARLDDELVTLGPEALHQRLCLLDPTAGSKMEPSNSRRIIRALEVCEGSGRPFSSFGPGVDTYPASEVQQVALRWPRDVLARRIEERVRVMIERGLQAEVENLLTQGLSPTALQALGYKEMVEHIEGRMSLEEVIATIVVKTRQFAVRQERWFRRDPRINWFDIESDPVTEVAPQLIGLLA
ncbi:MAG: tRNA (adenosine(37)-N6)-dimethylallyltransferase MiaA [Actinobacteria bacterium]|uniref:tRNA dimethylallyltransferase n=1 Tax=freshwater metagenome TaxID=449393 RepID=A0A6J6GCB3_9ZZZZ|nr:tRNA (adenosine(37)-N6)-dimethylallyltransferase MiaA [Actinomycetota bacterium]